MSDLSPEVEAEVSTRVHHYEERIAELEVGIEKALLLLTRIDHDEGSRIGRAIEALEKTCR